MKHSVLIILALLILIPSLSKAQLTSANPQPLLNSQRYLQELEFHTYRLYTQQKWDSLLTIGKQAIESDISGYYLFVRTATAAFYLGKYSLAIHYIQLARQIKFSDPYVDELLFYSYLYSGKRMQAHVLAKTGASAGGKQMMKKNFGPSAYIESGPVIYQKLKALKGKETDLYNDRITDKNGIYTLLGYKHSICPRLALTGSFSNVTLEKSRQVNIKYLDTLSGNYQVKQNEYYLSADILLSNRFILSPSINFASTSVEEPIKSTDSVTNLYLGPKMESDYTNYVAGTEISYNANYWTATAGIWYLMFNGQEKYQLQASYLIMPCGNLNLYSKTTLNYLRQRTTEPFVITELAGFKVTDKIWMELSGTLGNLAGTVEQNGQLINNQISRTIYRIESLVIFDLSQKIRLTARYQFSENENLYYTLNAENLLNQTEYKSYKHVITGGVTWHF